MARTKRLSFPNLRVVSREAPREVTVSPFPSSAVYRVVTADHRLTDHQDEFWLGVQCVKDVSFSS